mgnify:FL=1
MVELIVGLILAHLLSDFILQTDRIVEKKREGGWMSLTLLLHTLVAGILAATLSMQCNIEAIWIGIITAVSHYLIDALKIRWEQLNETGNAWAFIIDQVAHLMVIVALIIWMTRLQIVGEMITSIDLNNILVGLTGIILLLKPSSIFIQLLFGKWKVEQPIDEDHLPKAGEWIGYLERILIFIFIMADTYTVIGFLIAAKSILRFRESTNKRQVTEYVLLGTLLSFTLAIVVSLVIRYFINTV